MAVQENTNLTTDFAKAQSIDFVNRFTGGIKKLQEMLGITRRQGSRRAPRSRPTRAASHWQTATWRRVI